MRLADVGIRHANRRKVVRNPSVRPLSLNIKTMKPIDTTEIYRYDLPGEGKLAHFNLLEQLERDHEEKFMRQVLEKYLERPMETSDKDKVTVFRFDHRTDVAISYDNVALGTISKSWAGNIVNYTFTPLK